MCNKAILENRLFLTATEIKKMCNKAVDNYPHALEFVPKCYKTQNMCDKAVNIYPSTIKLFLNAL